jgi:mutator protein MutT
MTPAEQLALWADVLRDISAMGLRFTTNVHDRFAFQRVQNISMEMFGVVTGLSCETIEPLRTTIFSRPTPLVVGDAAVIDDDGQILLIRRADNGLWAMPGGAIEVGETPAEGVVREALEETGVRCRPTALVGVFDSRFCGATSSHQLCMFVFLCEPLEHEATGEPTHSIEVLETAWYAEDSLPEELDPSHVSRIPEAFRVWKGDGRTFFDGAERR